jgi:hypothetical protein
MMWERARHRAAEGAVPACGRRTPAGYSGMPDEIPLELIQRLPKTDLHCHLDGSHGYAHGRSAAASAAIELRRCELTRQLDGRGTA